MDTVVVDAACKVFLRRTLFNRRFFFVMYGRTRCTEVVGRNEDTRAELVRLQDAKNAADQEVNHRT